MDAQQFLDSDAISADNFLDEDDRTFGQKAISFVTMGHVYGDQSGMPQAEVSFTPEGEMTRADVPTADPGFFEDPVTALAMGAVAGARAAAGPIGKGLRAAREALGWFTGGASDVPTLAKAGAKGIVKAIEAKPLAKASEARRAKGVLESITPETRISNVADTPLSTVPKAAPKAVTNADDFLAGKEPAPAEIIQPAKTSQGIKRTVGIDIEDADPIFNAMNEAKKAGGFNLDILRKDYGDETVNSLMKRRPGIATKNGPLRLDEFAMDAGFDDGDSLMNAMLEGQTKKQFRRKMAGEVDALSGGNYDLIKRGYEPAKSVEAYKLGKGDKVIRNGEVFKVTDDKGGKLTLHDGETLKVPMEETLAVDGIKIKEIPRFSEETGTITGMSEAETFGLVNPETEIGRGPLSKKNMTPTSGLDLLAKEQTAQAQRGAVGLDIGKKEPKPTFKFDSPETEALFQSAKGIKPEGIGSRIKAIATEVGHKLTRDFQHLANKKENAQLIFDLKRLEKQKDVVADRTVRNIGETLSGLNRADYDLFSRKVIIDDLYSDFSRGLYGTDKELPFKLTPSSLVKERGRLDALVTKNPKIAEALEKRKAMWDQVKDEYIEALGPYKSGVEDMFKENYYRHQVLDYVAESGLFGTGKRLKTPQRGYMKGRKGVANLYNTDYIEAEHNIMAQMLHDAETAKTLTKIKGKEDIAKTVREKAKADGLDDWRKAIPEGYTTWQPKEGSVFYPVLTVEEKTAEQIMAGEIDEILGEGKDIFRSALAVGGKRKEWVVRNEVAETLNNLVREKSQGLSTRADKAIMRGWKQWQLISPRRYFKYNARNMTGDAEATFLGNPSGFKSMPKAIGELGDVFFGKKPMSKDMAAWFERGGVGSTLQAQEMDNLKQIWMFSRLNEKRGGDLNAWNKYWRTARLTTDFRESILRYSNFLDFKKQLIEGGGKPKSYGASKPEMIDALQDIDDKAYWLSNDLLGAYDRVSVAGQTIRERLIPFWSWQEVNFKRYIQLFRNAANDGELTASIGKKLGATSARTAMKVGGLAVKGAAFASMLHVYNSTFFPEEYKTLPADLKSTPLIILGRDEKGQIQYFNRMGTLDDFISWFGLDHAPRFVGDYLSGKKTMKELLKAQAKKTYEGPANKVWQGAAPFMKLTGELVSGRSTFPDVFQRGTIRDRNLHLARAFGLENEYIAMAGKPSKGYGESLKNLFMYRIDPGEAAYRTIFDLKGDFMKKLGKTSEGFWLTPTGDALYNMKLALRYDDKEAFSKYFSEYAALSAAQGKTNEDIRKGVARSVKNMHPLSGMNEQVRDAFVVSLNSDDKEALSQALKFYQDILAGNRSK